MSRPTFPYGKDVAVVDREVVGIDQYGNDVYQDVSTIIPGCVTWPKTSVETDNDSQDTVITGMVVLVPPGVTVRATGTFVVDGVAYKVDGDPFNWDHNPFTASRAGVQVELKRITG